MEYYFVNADNIDIFKQEIIVTGDEFRHLAKVLRKKKGDSVTITDGALNIYYCIILSVEKSGIKCRIQNTGYNLFESTFYLTLFISPLKNSERFEFAIEKSVELGVKSIQPVITEHTISKSIFSENKMLRMVKIIRSAVSQSQRCFLPEFKNAITFSEMLASTKDFKNKIAMYEFSEDRENIKLEKDPGKIFLFIGPEGGISKSEYMQLKENDWQLKSLGERKLRAETAAVVSVFDLLSKQKK